MDQQLHKDNCTPLKTSEQWQYIIGIYSGVSAGAGARAGKIMGIFEIREI
jgi:hypothetical protein